MIYVKNGKSVSIIIQEKRHTFDGLITVGYETKKIKTDRGINIVTETGDLIVAEVR